MFLNGREQGRFEKAKRSNFQALHFSSLLTFTNSNPHRIYISCVSIVFELLIGSQIWITLFPSISILI